MAATDERPLTHIDRADASSEEEPVAADASAETAPEQELREVIPPEPKPIPIPTRTLPLLALLLAIVSIVFVFCQQTVHRRTQEELLLRLSRPQESVAYWLEHGYFKSGGLEVRRSAANPVYFYRSSTGGLLISTFIMEKVYSTFTGRYSWRLQALHNQIVTLLTAALLGLLGFRLATRFGVPPLHALVLGAAIEILHYTFPDTLAQFWELNARELWLMFAAVFLLIEERGLERRTRLLTLTQALSAFLLTHMEYIAGLAFIGAYVVIVVVLRGDRTILKRVVLTGILPVVLAFAVFGAQQQWVNTQHPDMPQEGSTFLFRTGLDGSPMYYVNHLDIANRRDLARANFADKEYLFRWKWLFFAGTAALLIAVIAAMRGRVPPIAIVSLLSLLGSYLLYAAVFSQVVVIHPYLYDIMIYTPLVFALCVIVPSLVESMSEYRGVAVIAVFFLAIWVSMVQMRHYMLWYPPPPPAAAAPAK